MGEPSMPALRLASSAGRSGTPHRLLAGLGLATALALAGCGANQPQNDQPVNAEAAASMISDYRTARGLTPVTIDPALNQLAQEQANAMARADNLSHEVGGRTFVQRLKASGYPARTAVENVGAGYHTLAEAFSGWRDSPPHNKNMLAPGMTRMGIATANAPKSKYKVYWALVLAQPDAN